MLSFGIYGFLRVGYITRLYISKDNRIQIVPFYYMFYLLRMYDIHVPFERHYENKFDVLIPDGIESSTRHTLLQLFLFVQCVFQFLYWIQHKGYLGFFYAVVFGQAREGADSGKSDFSEISIPLRSLEMF